MEARYFRVSTVVACLRVWCPLESRHVAHEWRVFEACLGNVWLFCAAWRVIPSCCCEQLPGGAAATQTFTELLPLFASGELVQLISGQTRSHLYLLDHVGILQTQFSSSEAETPVNWMRGSGLSVAAILLNIYCIAFRKIVKILSRIFARLWQILQTIYSCL